MTTQAEFFQTHAVDGVLDEKLMGQMLMLPEGDTAFSADSGEPAATPAPTPAPPPVPGPDADGNADPDKVPEGKTPVILAKDGVHTIDYQRLVDARDGEKAAKAAAEAATAEAERLRLEVETLKKAPAPAPGPTPAPSPAPAGDKPDFGDYSDEALAKGIDKLVAQRVAAAVGEALKPAQKAAEKAALSEHLTTIYTAHPNMDAILESKEFSGWVTGQPSFTQDAIRAVLEKGTTTQVVELFDSYAKATGQAAAPPPPAPSPAPAVDVAKKAAEAVAAAQAKPPNSLSEIPGSSGVHDEATAMLEMNPMALMNKFQGKSPQEIHRLIGRVV